MMSSRRRFLKKSLISSLATIGGMPIVYGENIPTGYQILESHWQGSFLPEGKSKALTVLNDKPWNIETPAHLLDDAVTPVEKMFVRNNGLVPPKIALSDWRLIIDGESVNRPMEFSMQDIKSNFEQYTYQITLECGGNGRSEFYPVTSGNQWTIGAVHAAKWTGVRLKDVLRKVGLRPNAVYIGYYGNDIHLSNDPTKVVISRGVPMHKALEDETLLAYELNGAPLPLLHGWPLRLVVGGWPASVSGKWLNRISVRNKVHDGEKMQGDSYRVPCEPVAPGSEVADDKMCIIESMPVKSVITYPKSGAMLPLGKILALKGHAWAGDQMIQKMDISIDFGITWQACRLDQPANKYAWQHWSAQVQFPKKGYYEVWVKATDDLGRSQPMVVPQWNPKGYLNNACHRIAIKIV